MQCRTSARQTYAARTCRGADMGNARLLGADLRGANLINSNLSNADLREAKLHGANLCDAYLAKADLSEADLRAADLHFADLLYIRGLVPFQIKSAENWDTAFYIKEILEILCLKHDHNESLRKDLENSVFEENNRKNK